MFVELFSTIFLAVFVSASDVEELLSKGTKELSMGKFPEAISLYSDAIHLDKNNYVSYYRRATAFLAMGKVKSSISDLEKVIELNSLYEPARKQLGNAFIKLGNLEDAKKHFSLLPNSSETDEKLGKIDSLLMNFERTKDSHKNKKCKENLPILDDLVDSMPMHEELRKVRGECYFQTGEVNRGVQDLRQSVHLVNDNRKGLHDLSVMMYQYGFAVQALEEIRECLKLDQDDKDCHKHYKMLKKLVKAITKTEEAVEGSDWNGCVKQAKNILELEPEKESYQNQAKVQLCKCYTKIGSTDAITYCSEIVEKNPDNIDYRLNLAEAHLSNDEFDQAITQYQKVLEFESNNRMAKEGMEKAQRMKKKASSRNYYKILGVNKNASKKEILKAYRKLAAEWHPDRFDEKNKKNAEKKFIDITDAKEVLTDAEKRAQFDRGIDPLDPQAQSGGGGNPFHGGHPFHGGNPFGGGHNFHFDGFNPFEDGNFEFHFG